MIPKQMQKQYKAYISSPKWKIFRDSEIEKRKSHGDLWEPQYGDYICDRCSWNFPKDKLEVHHKHYNSLGQESPNDVMVVCKRCHGILDIIRAKEGKERAEEARFEAQLDAWASKKYGEYWVEKYDHYEITLEFEEWLLSKEGYY